MVKRTGPTNPELQKLIKALQEKADINLWKRLAKDLAKPTRQRRIVNIYKINKFARDGETIVVPGKVLSVGECSKKIKVVALSFSEKAREKLLKSKCEVSNILDEIKSNPNAKGIQIIK